MTTETLPTEPPPAPKVSLVEAQAFLADVKKLAEERGIAAVLVTCMYEQEGRLTVVADAGGREDKHAELAAQTYATHVLPLTQRAENLSRIASTPAVRSR